MNIHCIGIAGSGMLPLAVYLKSQGHEVTGSDRFRDDNAESDRFSLLEQKGITLFPQDGSGITPETDRIVYSVAVEPDTPDRKKAAELGIPETSRPEQLAECFNEAQGIAIGGTSGKSTCAGMTGFILQEAGRAPSLINGASVLNYTDTPGRGAFLTGTSDILCIEACESDGSIVNYRPETGVILNISKDHSEISELVSIFETFAENCSTVICNADSPALAGSKAVSLSHALSFSREVTGADLFISGIAFEKTLCTFTLNSVPFTLNIPGLHNIENAVGAAAAALQVGVELKDSAEILASFKGIERRMNIVGQKNGITVIDDYAHNGAKIEAALRTAKEFGTRVIAVYQPHGFGPTSFIQDDLVKAFTSVLNQNDLVFFTEIFYAGGTADKTITSEEITDRIKISGPAAETITRAETADAVAPLLNEGDTVIIMGARDITLGKLAKSIFRRIDS